MLSNTFVMIVSVQLENIVFFKSQIFLRRLKRNDVVLGSRQIIYTNECLLGYLILDPGAKIRDRPLLCTQSCKEKKRPPKVVFQISLPLLPFFRSTTGVSCYWPIENYDFKCVDFNYQFHNFNDEIANCLVIVICIEHVHHG